MVEIVVVLLVRMEAVWVLDRVKFVEHKGVHKRTLHGVENLSDWLSYRSC